MACCPGRKSASSSRPEPEPDHVGAELLAGDEPPAVVAHRPLRRRVGGDVPGADRQVGRRRRLAHEHPASTGVPWVDRRRRVEQLRLALDDGHLAGAAAAPAALEGQPGAGTARGREDPLALVHLERVAADDAHPVHRGVRRRPSSRAPDARQRPAAAATVAVAPSAASTTRAASSGVRCRSRTAARARQPPRGPAAATSRASPRRRRPSPGRARRRTAAAPWSSPGCAGRRAGTRP